MILPGMLTSRAHIPGLVIVATLAAIAYFPAFNAGFVYDDHILVEAVEAYHSFDLRQMILGLGNGLEYLPVRDLTLALDAATWGQDPRGYHLSNFLYFLLVIIMLYRVVRALATCLDAMHPGRVAFIVSLIFALHPLNSEAVAFIAARNNILALLFILISIHFFLAGADGRRLGFALSIAAFILALFSKASAVFYPAALILIYSSLVPRSRQRRQVWALLSVMLLLAIAGAVFHLNVASETGTAQPDLARYGVTDILTSLVRASLVPAFYLRYFLIPWPQSISYDEIAILEWAQAGTAIALYTSYFAAFVLAFRVRRQQPLVLIGLLWFYAALVPVSNIFPTFPFVADRYLFPGMPGLALILATGLERIRPRPVRWVLLGALASVLLIMTHIRNYAWQSDISLWEATWETTPRTGAHAYFNALAQDGEIEKALALAESETPQTYRYPMLLCELHRRHSRYAQALAACREALQRSEGYSPAVRNQIKLAFAHAHEKNGNIYDALHYYLPVMQEGEMTTRIFLGEKAAAAVSRLRLELGPQESSLREAADGQANDVRAQGEYGLFLLRTGRYAEAQDRLERASTLQPGNWQIKYNLGLAAIRTGDLGTAQNAFYQVPHDVPEYAEGLNHLAQQFNRRGETTSALDHWQQAVASQPANRSYRYNLARHYLRMGSKENARAVLEAGMSMGVEADRAFYRRAMENLGVQES